MRSVGDIALNASVRKGRRECIQHLVSYLVVRLLVSSGQVISVVSHFDDNAVLLHICWSTAYFIHSVVFISVHFAKYVSQFHDYLFRLHPPPSTSCITVCAIQRAVRRAASPFFHILLSDRIGKKQSRTYVD